MSVLASFKSVSGRPSHWQPDSEPQACNGPGSLRLESDRASGRSRVLLAPPTRALSRVACVSAGLGLGSCRPSHKSARALVSARGRPSRFQESTRALTRPKSPDSAKALSRRGPSRSSQPVPHKLSRMRVTVVATRVSRGRVSCRSSRPVGPYFGSHKSAPCQALSRVTCQ